LKTLLAGPCLDQGAVHREVLIGHQALRPFEHPPEETPGDLLIQQAVAILAEYRRRPDRFVHIHADEPAKQQVVVQLLHQQALAANRVEDLQQLRPQQPLRRDRGPPHAGIQPVELAGHVPEHLVDQRADGAQRMVGGHALLRRHITEHRIGLTVVSSHARHNSTGSLSCRSLD
jgi:hypothetical protein